MVRNIRNKAGEPSQVGAVKRSAGRPKKVVEPVGAITKKEVIKPLNMKRLAVSKPTVKKVVKEPKVKTEKPVAKVKKSIKVAVKNVSVKKDSVKSGMEGKLASIKKAKKVARPEVNVDMEIRSSSQNLETELAPAVSREETMALFADGKKAKGVFIVEKSEEETKIMMWTGVVFFMILIIAIWAYNIKAVIDVTSTARQGNTVANENVEDMKKNLQGIRQDLEKVRTEEAGRNDLFRSATNEGQAAPIDNGDSVVPAANASSSEVR